jgi:phage baseplate assembly protein W
VATTKIVTRKAYNFKSVGEKLQERIVKDNILPNELPIGIKTPLEPGTSNDGLFKMHFSIADQISDNLRNMLQTNHGERLGFYDFGGNLEPLTFELGQETADSEAVRRINTTVSKYMPYVELEEFMPLIDRVNNQHTAKVGFRVTYAVPKLGIRNKAIDVILYSVT